VQLPAFRAAADAESVRRPKYTSNHVQRSESAQQRVEMSTADLWITTRVTESCSRYPLVTEAVSARLKELLNGQLSERQLSPADLTSVAEALISDMVPATPTAEARQ
jgi:hypothetical protein